MTVTATDEWTRCAGCSAIVYLPRLARAHQVCPECGHHHRLRAMERIATLVDEGSFRPAVPQVRGGDPLGFSDTLPYTERLTRARAKTGLDDAIVYGRASIGARPAVVAAMDFAFLGGSMGSAVGEAVTRACELAVRTRLPLVLAIASGGARMQEGTLSLMQMGKTAQAMSRLRQEGLLSVCVLTDPTFGGVTASFATLGDVLVAERGALIGFAGPRVIAAATRERLPEGFQSAEYLFAGGMLDRVEPREGLRPLLSRLLALTTPHPPQPPAVVVHDPDELTSPRPPAVVRDPDELTGPSRPHETVRLARDTARPTALDYIWHLCTDFVELHGDRLHGDDPAIVGGPAMLGGAPVMIVAHQKGHDTKELVARNFGLAHPEGYRKALRLMRLADRLGLPVVTFVDTQGAAPGVGAEDRGQSWAIAECLAGMSELAVPVVAAVIGEGGSGGALALAVANRVLMLRHAVYSVISPESCSTILHGDPSHALELSSSLRITAPDLLRLGVVDGVVPEPPGGAQENPAAAMDALREAVLEALGELAGMDGAQLRKDRYERFRRLGVVEGG
ncbi:acetyl-CoA carboxylase carboxyltransferase subunit alpha [Nonomuraea endophytica]|uniref:Multifunctional fusion protein n=1 Tax=Nonomuraea endophytica TaxID=714136 RepID=A0A7W8EF66_9ACTN|nr:acetyl-CoA carboxylase carboxyltransferase subunit alpha [Nonomuraea endophytica]MBB5077123.1 acetyl-CoA carboxylase carboxyl transferase subunit beta [Nonomuraea endophytica]